ncbi:hypothetical protein [Sporolactobacillus sp. STSJ-5]|nr:hypothetical protein [Sporolactobacillus sp. STSJ-5]
MTDREKAQDLIDDLSWIMDRLQYQEFLWNYDRLSKMNEVGRR